MNIVIAAASFAAYAHRHQRRKYTNEPYFNHPIRVAEIVKNAGGTPEMIAAAYLHDVREDCEVEDWTLRDIFGNYVADLVGMLTDVSKPGDGKRAVRRAIDRDHSAKATPEGQTIKVADILANFEDIIHADDGFAEVWVAEKVLLLEVLPKADPRLLALARGKVESFLPGAMMANG